MVQRKKVRILKKRVQKNLARRRNVDRVLTRVSVFNS